MEAWHFPLQQILFYCACHPWAELIRPRRFGEYSSSMVLFSKQVVTIKHSYV